MHRMPSKVPFSQGKHSYSVLKNRTRRNLIALSELSKWIRWHQQNILESFKVLAILEIICAFSPWHQLERIIKVSTHNRIFIQCSDMISTENSLAKWKKHSTKLYINFPIFLDFCRASPVLFSSSTGRRLYMGYNLTNEMNINKLRKPFKFLLHECSPTVDYLLLALTN